jgi:hypothetical protein
MQPKRYYGGASWGCRSGKVGRLHLQEKDLACGADRDVGEKRERRERSRSRSASGSRGRSRGQVRERKNSNGNAARQQCRERGWRGRLGRVPGRQVGLNGIPGIIGTRTREGRGQRTCCGKVDSRQGRALEKGLQERSNRGSGGWACR